MEKRGQIYLLAGRSNGGSRLTVSPKSSEGSDLVDEIEKIMRPHCPH